MKNLFYILLLFFGANASAQIDSFPTNKGRLFKGDSTMFNGQFFTQINSSMNGKDVLLMYVLGQSNAGTDPNLGPLNIDSMPSYLKGAYPNVLIDTIINSQLYFTPLITNGIGAGYLNETLWRLSQIYRYVMVIKRSLGGTSLSPLTYPISDFINYANTMKPYAHDIIDSNRCDKMIYYDQCETDGASLGSAVTYGTNFLNLMNTQVKPNVGPLWVLVKRCGNMQTDFPYIPQVAIGQDSVKLLYPTLFDYINTDSLPMKGEGVKTGLTYNGDYSHHREETALKIGDLVADAIENHFGKNKTDRTKPRMVKATINAAGTILTLKFTKEMQSKSAPHTYAFTCGTKIFSSITINGDSVVLIPTIPFYSGVSYTLSYSKDAHMKINLRGKYGNEVSSFSSFPIINNCTVASPSFSTIYTSNFTTLGSNPADLPNWWTTSGTAGSTATANSTSITGVTACAKFDMVSGSGFRFYKWTTTGMNTSGKIYQVSFDIEVPRTMSLTGAPNSLYMMVDNLDHSGQFDFTKFIRRDKMSHVEYQFTEGTPTNDDVFFEFGLNSNSTVYIKNVIIKSN